jgi:hypothetical protein
VPDWARLTSSRLVGRDAELGAAVAAIGRVQDGPPGVIMVSGPAGIGKTRLVTALVDRPSAEGKRVLSGACLDLGAGAPPYSAFIAAFRSVDPPAVPAARRADRRSRHAQAKGCSNYYGARRLRWRSGGLPCWWWRTSTGRTGSPGTPCSI